MISSMGSNGYQIQYRDTNKRAGKLIRQRVNLTADYQIYFCEIDLKTNEIELNQEKISYSIGKKNSLKDLISYGLSFVDMLYGHHMI